jgi:hypothetical protein
MTDKDNSTEEVDNAPEAISTDDNNNVDDIDMSNVGADAQEERTQRPSKISRIFAAIPPIPEYPIAKPVETEQDDDSMEPGFGTDEDGEDTIDDLVDISDDDMDDLVGMDDVVGGDLSKDIALTPQDEDFLYGTGPELPRPKKTVKYGASSRKRSTPRETDTYMSGLL